MCGEKCRKYNISHVDSSTIQLVAKVCKESIEIQVFLQTSTSIQTFKFDELPATKSLQYI